jgi:hypothetical protein
MSSVTTLFPRATPVGYWRRRPSASDNRIVQNIVRDTAHLPDPVPCERTPEEREMLLAYLTMPHTHEAWRGYHTCRLCGVPAGSHEVCDGAYVWPEGLAHYVAEHAVALPEAFVAHVRAQQAATRGACVFAGPLAAVAGRAAQ